MKQKILKLAKQLNRFTVDELAVLLEEDSPLIEPIIAELIEDYIFKQVGEKEYIYIPKKIMGKKKRPKRTFKEIDGKKIDLTKEILKTSFFDFASEEQIEKYKKASPTAKAKAYKYLKVFEEANHLRGAKLIAFLEQWGKDNPDLKVSYACFMRKKQDYRREGITALLSKYGNNKLSDELYQIFKSIYLKPDCLSAKECKRIMEKKLGIKVPVSSVFLKWLNKEYSKAEIFKLRSVNIPVKEFLSNDQFNTKSSKET